MGWKKRPTKNKYRTTASKTNTARVSTAKKKTQHIQPQEIASTTELHYLTNRASESAAAVKH